MANTTNTVITDGGGDYLTLNAAEDGIDGTAYGAGETATINCSGTTADTTPVTFAGWDADVSVIINGDAHTGIYDTGHYRLETVNSATDTLDIDISNATVNGIQVRVTVTTGASDIAAISGNGTNNVVKKCICYAVYSEFKRGYGINLLGTSGYAFNNVIYDFRDVGTASSIGIVAQDDAGGDSYYIYSNTVYNCRTGIYNTGSGTFQLKNNISNGCTSVDYSVTGVNASATNISEDATSPDVAFRSKAVTFVGETSSPRDLHLASTDTNAKDAGTDTSGEAAPLNFTDDIDGVTRTGTWDIGADEYTPSGGASGTVLNLCTISGARIG